MSYSFKTVKTIINDVPPLSLVLREASSYYAHIDKKQEKAPELLEEHYDRVNKYFVLLCEQNDLDTIIDGMITTYVQQLFPKSETQQLGEYVKSLFVFSIVFHDFGKVNENFQAKKDKMNNPRFKENRSNPLKHHHSKLGAYMYVCKHFQQVMVGECSFLDKSEVPKMMLTILVFSYAIFRHHSSKLLRPDGTGIRFEREELAVMKDYLHYYQMVIHPTIAEHGLLPEHLDTKLFQSVFQKELIDYSFQLFALLRLNFSLLTAADYIATAEYSYGLKLETANDWGVMDAKLRKAIIFAAKTSQSYNTNAHTKAIEEGYVFKNPEIPNKDNLNILRTEMAIKVLRAIKANVNKRLFYLEAPTGGGKTNLSMLALAELLAANPELNKVFYVFPFTTLITQTHKSIKDTLSIDDENIGLMHSKVGFQTLKELEQNRGNEENEDGLYGEQRKDFLQNLFALYPVSLLTHVRFFDIIKSNRKESIYLMHRLANSIIILDELQSYPPYHWEKIMYFLEQYGRCFNIRFILMSATLPRLDKIDAVRRAIPTMPKVYDLLVDSQWYFQNKNFSGRVSFNFELMGEKEITEEALAKVVLEKSKQRSQRVESEGRVFTIVEFIYKKTATTFKTAIEGIDTTFFDKILVLSGTVLESRRRTIINFLKKNQETKGLKVLLITTQVVEAGVDIDMDLGFKNVSLIDSDEQLAGRVNRNVSKLDCEVYLFKLNEPKVLYGRDLRYKVTKDNDAFHKHILETKDFKQFYERVFPEIEKNNQSTVKINFQDDYLGYFKRLDFPKIHEHFKLIEQKNFSVFVPLVLPLQIEGEKTTMEDLFSPFEQQFLKKHKVIQGTDKNVDGELVWELFMAFGKNPNEDFIGKKVERKAIQGILAKFTFSMFDNEKVRLKIRPSCCEERSFEDYFYMHRWDLDKVYSLESGLNETQLNANFI